LPDDVVSLPHRIEMGRRPQQFLTRAKILLSGKFRVAIHFNNRIWPFDCAFRDWEIEQTSGSPFVAWYVFA
jgi:hypothetical protein